MTPLLRLTGLHNERIEDFMPDDTVRLPGFVIPEGETGEQTLVKESIAGLRKLGLPITRVC
jgi:hypothetical protein